MNYSDLENASLQILSQKAATNLFWTVFAPLSIATNLLVATTILFSESLHNKSHFVILSHSIVETIFAFAHFGTGLVRYIYYCNGVSDASTQLVCTLKQTPMSFMRDVAIMLTLMLALDRVLCLTKPLFYNSTNTSVYIIVLNAICCCYAVLRNSLAFVGYDEKKWVAACVAATAYHADYGFYGAIENQVVVALTAVVYMAAALIMWRRYKTTTFSGESQRSDWRRRMDLDVFFAIVTIGAIYLICWGTAATVSSVSGAINRTELSIKLAVVIASPILVGSSLHLFVYLWFNRSFRKAFFSVVLRKPDDSVQPF